MFFPFIFIAPNNSHYINLFKSFLISIVGSIDGRRRWLWEGESSQGRIGRWSLLRGGGGWFKKLIFINFSFCDSPQSFSLFPTFTLLLPQLFLARHLGTLGSRAINIIIVNSRIAHFHLLSDSSSGH